MDICFITIVGLRKYDEAQKGETRAFPEVIASVRAACHRLVVRQRIWATSGEVREMADICAKKMCSVALLPSDQEWG